MQLTIGNYRITSDERCFVVEEHRVVKEGKNAGQEYWAYPQYPTTLQQACVNVLRREIHKAEAFDLGQVLAAIERAERNVTEAVANLTVRS